MNAHLAYMTGRSFVFDNFTWSRGNAGGLDEFNGRLIPAEIPTTALISGPVVGGPFPKNDSMLRAIKKTYWHQICPEPYKVRKEDINPTMPDQPTALTMLNTWIDVINKIDNPCVQIDGYDSRVFDMYVYGDPRRYVDIWPSLRQSPVVQYWGYSPLIHEAYEANKALISGRPTPLSEPYYFCNSPQAGANGEVHAGPYRCSDPYAPLPGLLALHIRRGDFENHCRHLANWSSEWNGINLLPELPDRFVIPDGSGGGQATPSAMAHYLKRCYPDMKQIVEKLDDVRRSEAGKGLSEVYVMTNGKLEWANELKAAIMKMGGWNKVVSSRDLVLTREQREVGQAVDMMIGERAQVVIGNGWSSLTSGIVMMRLARGHSLESNRFW
ncbi:hypothetical protein BDW22DRAFT_1377377 [Trametopsis cervina]|nr:hypothetical protein BDW22DRAFT_1377377 [Trametopsis cervina]